MKKQLEDLDASKHLQQPEGISLLKVVLLVVCVLLTLAASVLMFLPVMAGSPVLLGYF